MQRNSSNLERLMICALMIALSVILTRFISITTPMVRIGFGYLPIVLIAVYYGPWWAGGSYVLADIIGATLFPSGAFFPGFTLSALLTGIIYGIILYRREITWQRTLLAVCVVLIGINLILNTWWIAILMGKGYIALLPTRIVKELICIPIDTVLILAVVKAAYRVKQPITE